MDIEKAKEILNQYLREGYIMSTQDLHDAMALGIEALKDLISIRETFPLIDFGKLPGETKD